MSLIKLKCKVKLPTEEQMEVNIEGIDWKDTKWAWKNKGFRVCDIWDITEFDSRKTVVTLIEGPPILVIEPFDAVFKKWKESEPEDLIIDDTSPEEEAEINEDEE